MDSPQYLKDLVKLVYLYCFKPYYKWIVLNTVTAKQLEKLADIVLNLIING